MILANSENHNQTASRGGMTIAFSHDARKRIFGVSDQLQHMPACCRRRKLEALNFGFKKKGDGTVHVAKTKAQLICIFVFAQAKNPVFS